MKDFHIHIYPRPKPVAEPGEFLRRTVEAGVDGGAVFSLPPASSTEHAEDVKEWRERLDGVLSFTSQTPGFLPILRMDPTESDAREQVLTAAERGIRGFKVICTHFYPKECLEIFRLIADTGLPLIFHSGILWGPNASAEYNRPVNFEHLIYVKGLRFSLAHIGWPWCEEYAALYGRFAYQHGAGLLSGGTEFFVDLTPGTPFSRRREMLRMLFSLGYDLARNVLWGSDGSTNSYPVRNVRQWLDLDRGIFREIQNLAEISPLSSGLAERSQEDASSPPEDLFSRIADRNFERFFSRAEQS